MIAEEEELEAGDAPQHVEYSSKHMVAIVLYDASVEEYDCCIVAVAHLDDVQSAGQAEEVLRRDRSDLATWWQG